MKTSVQKLRSDIELELLTNVGFASIGEEKNLTKHHECYILDNMTDATIHFQAMCLLARRTLADVETENLRNVWNDFRA